MPSGSVGPATAMALEAATVAAGPAPTWEGIVLTPLIASGAVIDHVLALCQTLSFGEITTEFGATWSRVTTKLADDGLWLSATSVAIAVNPLAPGESVTGP